MLVVTLLARDEVDVVAANVEHHLDQGADLVIVTDNGSVDGTREVLEEYARRGVVRLIHQPVDFYDQARWVTRMARMAAVDHGADWVVNVDADEFWQPVDPAQSLSTVLARVSSAYGAVVARRVNLVGPADDQVPWPRRLVYRDVLSLSERGTPLGPKVCHRGAADVVVAFGNHAVDDGLDGGVLDTGVIEILHVPMRTYDQFERKIHNGATSVERNAAIGPETSWHWRADLERLRNGTLRAAYEARLPSAPELAARSEQFVYDDSMVCALEALVDSAVAPRFLRRTLDGTPTWVN